MRGSRVRIAFLVLFLAAAAFSPKASARIIDGVVAVVSEEPITFSEVREAVGEAMSIPVGDADLYLREEKDAGRILQWIESLIDAVLVKRDLAKIGQAVSDQDVTRALDSVRKTNNMSDAEFSEALAREGLSMEGYRRRLKWQMERGAIVRAKKFKEVAVTEEEVKAYYRENAERFMEGDEVRLETLHLPLPPEEQGADQVVRLRIGAQQAAAYVRAGRTLAEAADLLKGYLPGTSVFLSDFVHTADLQPEIRKEIRRLRTGESSPPFFTEAGGYILTVVARRGGTLPEFSSLKEALTEELADRRSEKAFADILAELKKAASIDVRL